MPETFREKSGLGGLPYVSNGWLWDGLCSCLVAQCRYQHRLRQTLRFLVVTARCKPPSRSHHGVSHRRVMMLFLHILLAIVGVSIKWSRGLSLKSYIYKIYMYISPRNDAVAASSCSANVALVQVFAQCQSIGDPMVSANPSRFIQYRGGAYPGRPVLRLYRFSQRVSIASPSLVWIGD